MSNPVGPIDLARLRALHEAAVSAPWDLAWEDGKHGVIAAAADGKFVALVGNNDDDPIKNEVRKNNAALIAEARNALGPFIEAVEALQNILNGYPRLDVSHEEFRVAVAKLASDALTPFRLAEGPETFNEDKAIAALSAFKEK